MAARSELLLAFYGDDFTGSTDAMEALALSGLRTVLFLSPPTPELLAQQVSRSALHGRRGHQPRDVARRNGRRAEADLARAVVGRSTAVALQGVLDVRFITCGRQHRPRGRHGARDVR